MYAYFYACRELLELTTKMKQFNQFQFDKHSIPLLGTPEKPFILCTDILVKCLGHRLIQDSHFFRTNRTEIDLFLYDGRTWFFTASGLVQTLKRSHKKQSKAVLSAFETRVKEIHNEREMTR